MENLEHDWMANVTTSRFLRVHLTSYDHCFISGDFLPHEDLAQHDLAMETPVIEG